MTVPGRVWIEVAAGACISLVLLVSGCSAKSGVEGVDGTAAPTTAREMSVGSEVAKDASPPLAGEGISGGKKAEVVDSVELTARNDASKSTDSAKAPGDGVRARRTPAARADGAAEDEIADNLEQSASPDADKFEMRDPRGRAKRAPAKVGSAETRATEDEDAADGAIESVDEETWGPSEQEIWIVEAPEKGTTKTRGSRDAGGPESASLFAVVDGVRKPLPLEHTRVRGSLTGPLASVRVLHRFVNRMDAPFDAVCCLRMPQHSTLDEFILRIGDRHIRAVVRERETARRIYEKAIAAGRTAVLIAQFGDDRISQLIHGIQPGVEVSLEAHWFATAPGEDDSWQLRVPLVMTAGFNPPALTSARPETPVSTWPLDVADAGERFAERAGSSLDVEIDLDAALPLAEVTSPVFPIRVKLRGERRAKVVLEPQARLPNEDFILRWRVAVDGPRAVLLTEPVSDLRAGADRWVGLLLAAPAGSAFPGPDIHWAGWAMRDAEELADADDAPFGSVLLARARGEKTGKVRLRVRGPEGPIRFEADEPAPQPLPALESLWARRRVAHLLERIAAGEGAELEGEVRSLGLDHGVVSPFTSFVLVDALSRVPPGQGVRPPEPRPRSGG